MTRVFSLHCGCQTPFTAVFYITPFSALWFNLKQPFRARLNLSCPKYSTVVTPQIYIHGFTCGDCDLKYSAIGKLLAISWSISTATRRSVLVYIYKWQHVICKKALLSLKRNCSAIGKLVAISWSITNCDAMVIISLHLQVTASVV